ncbi:MAG TPA: hypothetical protein VH639_18125 [Bryobacteraceae bacterium]
MQGTVLRYSRSLEIEDVAVPASQLSRLKDLYHQIGVNEKSKVVLKPR